MLNFGECFLIIIKKDDSNHTIVNSFFPDHMNYGENRVSKLLQKVIYKLGQWNDNYYRDTHEQLAVAVGERDSVIDGAFKIIKVI